MACGSSGRCLLVLALLAALCLQQAAAKKTTAQIRKDDRSLILVAEPFGFGEDGQLNITVSKFQIWHPGQKPGHTGPSLQRCVAWRTRGGQRRSRGEGRGHFAGTAAPVRIRLRAAPSLCLNPLLDSWLQDRLLPHHPRGRDTAGAGPGRGQVPAGRGHRPGHHTLHL